VIGAIVLAAGSGSRFGGTKQLAPHDGRPLVRHAVDAAREAGIERIVVVVGHDADAVAGAAGEGVRIARNRRFADGQSTSLVTGIDALGDDVDAALVLLADQPGVTAAMLRQLVAAAASSPEPVVRLRFVDAPGPVVLRRSVWDDLRRLEGDVGARAFIDRHPESVRDVFVATPAPPDVDTPDDLDRLARPDDDDWRRRADPGREKPPSF
jgi:molybdenum cofactor cytidylyltransferase